MATTKGTWSISGLAREAGRDRRTVQAALEGCEAAEQKEIGNRTERRYTLAAVLRHLLARQATTTGTGSTDAGFLDRAQEQARLWKITRESRELDVLERQRGLIPAHEVETEMAALVKSFVGFLESIPDILERDAGISGEAVERLQQIIDRERERLYQSMLARIDREAGTTTP